MISWDGYLYVQLADILCTPQFPSKWDFLRTPLFPLSLKTAFAVGGKNPLSVIWLNTFWGVTGIVLIVSVVKQRWGSFLAAVSLLFLSLYPALIVYEHCLLSEVSTFFCLALIIKLSCDHRLQYHYLLKALFLILGVTIGYYFRPTLLYLSPLAALLYGLSFLWQPKEVQQKNIRQPKPLVILMAILLITVGPFIAAYPWKQISKEQGNRRMAQQIIWGFVKQAAIPLNSPLLGATAGKYQQSIEQSLINGRLMMDGVRADPLFYDVAFSIYKDYGLRLDDFIRETVFKAPDLYLKRVAATLLYFIGFPGMVRDTSMFMEMVLADDTGSKFWPGPEDMRKDIERDFSRSGGKNYSLPWTLRRLHPFFSILTMSGWAATVFVFIAGVMKREGVLLAFSAIPLAFLLMHALALMANDRLILPVEPLVLANVVTASLLLFQRWRSFFFS